VTSQNIDVILDERARELCGEQQRWFDLKRTGKLIERVTRYNDVAGENIKNFHILRPIPQPQLDAITNKTSGPDPGGFWHKKIYPWQMWLDGIYMASPFLAQYAKEFNEPEWFDAVALQIELDK
jgi:Glycosyl Hydrolase Family 88/SusD family